MACGWRDDLQLWRVAAVKNKHVMSLGLGQIFFLINDLSDNMDLRFGTWKLEVCIG
jgi:hypothetical protein